MRPAGSDWLSVKKKKNVFFWVGFPIIRSLKRRSLHLPSGPLIPPEHLRVLYLAPVRGKVSGRRRK